MLKISENIEEKVEHYRDWYKQLDTMVNEHFETTQEFENSVSIGQRFLFDSDKPELPKGLTIPEGSNITLEKLMGRALVITGKSTTGNITTIYAGIRSSRAGD